MNIEQILNKEHLGTLTRVAILMGIGLPSIYALSKALGSYFKKRSSEHLGLVVQKAIFLLGFTIIAVTILYEFGFQLTALLGAAGIASVAIGFASQTSLSNIISGIFLYWEKPFQVGDIIEVNNTRGVVMSIDLMSVKLRQFDNLFVRIPNETMIKAQVTNITRFPIRRLDIKVGVAYKEDIDKVVRVLKEVADENPHSLDEPEPIVIFENYGDSSLNFMLGIWFEKSEFLKLKNEIMADIKKRFDREGIEIPFPHHTLYTGEATKPFPIQIVSDDSKISDI